jgi:hypothetical protein
VLLYPPSDDTTLEYGVALLNFDMLKPAGAAILAAAYDENAKGSGYRWNDCLRDGADLCWKSR